MNRIELLIDTDILIQHLTTKDEQSVLEKLCMRYNCFTSVINASEIYGLIKEHDKEIVNGLFYSLKVLGLNSRYCFSIGSALRSVKGKKADFFQNLRNSVIVSLAKENKLTIATFDNNKYSCYSDIKTLIPKK